MCLTPKTTPRPPITAATIAGTSSDVDLGAVLDNHKRIDIVNNNAENLPLISGNG